VRGEQQKVIAYEVVWENDGVACRGEFAPSLGQLKPDDEHTRELLSLPHLRVAWEDAKKEDAELLELLAADAPQENVEVQPEPKTEEAPLTPGQEACLPYPVRASQPWPYIFSVRGAGGSIGDCGF
jgi:hypothetical protein